MHDSGLSPGAADRWPALALLVLLGLAALHSRWPAADTAASGRATLPAWAEAGNPDLWPALDHMLKRLPVDPDGRLRYDARTLAAVRRAADAVQGPLTPAERQRLRLLTSRALPAAADQTRALLADYLAYRDALAALPAGASPARRRLQESHFGDRAATLFQDENAMRDAIRADTGGEAR